LATFRCASARLGVWGSAALGDALSVAARTTAEPATTAALIDSFRPFRTWDGLLRVLVAYRVS
jgi:hypothetical protein